MLSFVVIEHFRSNVNQNERVTYQHFDFANSQNNIAVRTLFALLYQLRNVSKKIITNFKSRFSKRSNLKTQDYFLSKIDAIFRTYR